MLQFKSYIGARFSALCFIAVMTITSVQAAAPPESNAVQAEIDLLVKHTYRTPFIRLKLGLLYLINSQHDKAREWIEQAATVKNQHALYLNSLLAKKENIFANGDSGPIAKITEFANSGDARAQHLLGFIYANGVGVEKSGRDAVRWYRTAAESGNLNAATSLATAHFWGRGIPRNLDLAEKWARLAKNDSLLSTIDAERRKPQKPPEPPLVPLQESLSSFPEADAANFTDHFVSLRKQPVSANGPIAEALKKRTISLPPPYLFELARRLLDTDRQEAFAWYWVGQIRSHYDAVRCADKTARQGMRAMRNLASQVIKSMRHNKELARAAAQSALEREALFPADTNPDWICSHGIRAFLSNDAASPGRYQLIPKAEWSENRQKLRKILQDVVDKGF